ncbi:MAG TPA: Lrp/AsnC family transcriptional regulator [Caulobacteraceae bacterium]|jgi:DNA-binding Lrp family transcriptional regulator
MAARAVDSYCISDETPTYLRHIANADRQMDELDRRLIDLLRENARAPAARLARDLGVSRTTLQSRLERLERSGVVTGYTVRLSDAHERGQIHAYVLMTVSHKQSAAVTAAVRRMNGVRLLQSVSGPFDLIASVAAPSVVEMDGLIDALGALPGVERTTSSIVLSTKIDR